MSGDREITRRSFLQSAALIAAGAAAGEALLAGSRPLAATARGPEEPDPPNETVARILRERFGDRTIQRGHVTLDMPDSAEDGRVVPVGLESDLPMTEAQHIKGVYLIIDHNPDPLVIALHLTPSLGPLAINTRIKMRRTSWIRAIIETNTGEVWADYKKVETTLNGCG